MTYGQIDDLMENAAINRGREAEKAANVLREQVVRLESAVVPAHPDQVKNTHHSVKTAVKIARIGLAAGAFALFAQTLNQIPPIVALGWCDKHTGDGAKAECYTAGVTAIAVGVLAVIGGVCAWVGAYAQFYVTKTDPDAAPIL